MIPCQTYPSISCMTTRGHKLPLVNKSRKILSIDFKSITKNFLMLYNESDYVEQITESPFHENDTLRNVCFMTRFKHL